MADPNSYTQAIGVALNDAKSMLGKNEVPNRTEIQSYLRDGGQDLDPHKLAWCAAFVSASLQKAGLPVPTQVVKDSAFGPGAYAPNYLSYGSAVEPKSIQAGDILVANNGGHVGFAEGPIRQGQNGPEVQLLAGNERDLSGQYAPGSYTNPTTGAVANRSQVGQVGERWVPLSGYSARRYQPTDDASTTSAAPAASPAASPTGTTLNSNIIDTLSRNISGIETGGSRNPYSVLQSRTGAVGKYQVMPFNVGPWTQQALGHAETPDEFRNDTAAQEAVFRDQASRALKTMSPADFASTWFTGKPYSQATSGASDYTGTTNRNYVARATQGIDNAFAATGATAAAPATAAGAPNSTAGGPAAPAATPTLGTTIGKLAEGLKPLAPSQGGQGGQGGGAGQDELKPIPAPQTPPAQAAGGPMMMGYGGQNTMGQRLAEQALAQKGFLTQPSLAAFTPGMPQQPMTPPGAAMGIPGLPGTTLNSPSQLQMALMTGQMSPYDLYASGGYGAGGFQGSA